MMWATEEKSARFAFDFYDGKVGTLEFHSSYPTHYKVSDEYEVPYGLSVLPQQKRDLWGFHGPKNIDHIKKIYELIEARF